MMILYDEPVEHDRLRRTDMASHKIVDMQAEISFASPAAIGVRRSAQNPRQRSTRGKRSK
jgi:hypothetical protein